MNNFRTADDVDQAIDTLIARPDSEPMSMDREQSELLGIAAELRTLPDPAFRSQLKANLMGTPIGARPISLQPVYKHVHVAARKIRSEGEIPSQILPTLFGADPGGYPMHQRSFATSLAMHITVLALLVGSGVFAAHEELKPHVTATLILPSDYVMSIGSDPSRGGGGGGTKDGLPASTGHPPKFSAEQLAPPKIVVARETKLRIPPTVIGPPAVTFPQNGPMGDPLSAALTPSNGPGSGGGIGSNNGTGVGPGRGPGVGVGEGGSIGGGVYRAGIGGVSAPRPIYDPEPEYSEEARKAKFQGDVVLSVIVGPDGRPRDIHVQRSVGMGLDARAIAAVSTWRFQPGMMNERPVAVQVSIEVSFRLF
jgi:periplasmic protein TonB